MLGIIWSQILGDVADAIFVEGQTIIDAATVEARIDAHAPSVDIRVDIEQPAEINIQVAASAM